MGKESDGVGRLFDNYIGGLIFGFSPQPLGVKKARMTFITIGQLKKFCRTFS